MAEKRTVTVISKDKRYRKSPFRSIATEKPEWNTFLTGQHINPYDTTTLENLTVEQMRGKVPLTEKQTIKFGFVINPDNNVNIRDNMKLDVSLDNEGRPINHKDYWIYEYLKYQDSVVLKEENYNPDVHRFYLQDKEYEATVRIKKRDLIYKAVELVRKDMSMDRLSNLSILMNYYIPSFNVDADKVSKIQLEDMIYQHCESNPEDLMKCFDKGWEENLYILRLAQKRIIQRKGDDFFDGNTYIGKGLESVKIFMNKADNVHLVNKWSSYLSGNVAITHNKDNNGIRLYEEGIDALFGNDIAKLIYCKNKLTELEEFEYLLKLKNAEDKYNFRKQNKFDDADFDKDKKIIAREEIEDDTEVENTEVTKDNLPSLHSLRIKAGKMSLPKEEWGSMDEVELYKYIENNKK